MRTLTVPFRDSVLDNLTGNACHLISRETHTVPPALFGRWLFHGAIANRYHPIMGIHGLAKLIADHAPSAIKEQDIKSYFGRKIAIDASMCMYQFLIAVRQDGNVLQNEDGETTSHLMGMFYRTIRMLEHGIKPVYVFAGKPPQLKSSEVSAVLKVFCRFFLPLKEHR
uniref:Flap structure-specific endonuclease 1 n=1 Tax=Oryzias latipes TaxID=8090 RepID=A0A3B3I1G6_ORYLA